MRYFLWIYVLVAVTAISILGFRGEEFKDPPIEVFPDMDRQLKFLEQSENNLFSDGRSDRLPPQGSVSRGNALDMPNVFSSEPSFGSSEFRTGILESAKPSEGQILSDESFVEKIPDELEIDMALMRQGQKAYQIHCSNCHGVYGNGRGVIAHFGLVPKNLSDPSQSTFLEDALPWSDGKIFNAITHGSASRIMLGMADKLTPKERWAVVLYVRALQNYIGAVRPKEVSP